MKRTPTLIFLMLFVSVLGFGQRYLTEVFTEVTIDSAVIYGANASVITYQDATIGEALTLPLYMDVYRPTTDTETERPLILYFHTGNFGPFQVGGQFGVSGSCGGTIRDSTAVEICTRLAKMGYVVASCDYRLGWNPYSTDESVRRYSLINAAYRGVQDARTAIRYFKKFAHENGNAWGTDTTKIALWGQGTGGYISLNTAFLDDYNKIPLTPGGKFFWDPLGTSQPIPMVHPSVNGDIYGTSYGEGPNLIDPTKVDTFCVPNHVGYTSDFQLAINMAGAIGDSSWVTPGAPPLISYHVPTDNFAPYVKGILTVPGFNYDVVEVFGSYYAQEKMEAMGSQDIFLNNSMHLSLQAEQTANFAASPAGLQTVHDGLYPILQDSDGNGIPVSTAPWEWAAADYSLGCNLDKASALTYIDTIVEFYAPRACFALGLTDCINKITNTEEISDIEVGLTYGPNPTTDVVNFRTDINFPIQRVMVYSATGAILSTENNLQESSYTLHRNNLPVGNYWVQLIFEDGAVTKQISFD